jgi:hypothetical protein
VAVAVAVVVAVAYHKGVGISPINFIHQKDGGPSAYHKEGLIFLTETDME